METRASLGRLGHHLLPPHCLGQHATSPLEGVGRFALFAPLGLLSGPWAWLSQIFRRSALEIIQAHLSLLASATSALPLQHLPELCSTHPEQDGGAYTARRRIPYLVYTLARPLLVGLLKQVIFFASLSLHPCSGTNTLCH